MRRAASQGRPQGSLTNVRTALLVVAVLVVSTVAVGSASSRPAGLAGLGARSGPVPPPPVPCDYVPAPPAVFGPAKNVGTPADAPKGIVSELMTIKTNRGTMRIKLATADAPCTVNSFRFLASKKYFDNTKCHRLTTSGIYVLQCGDPFATGEGGPGYAYRDENLVGATYPAGTVAMANAGPHTNGSQFFIVYRSAQLQPLYTPFGRADAATVEMIRGIAEGGTDHGSDGHPRTSVLFKTLRITAH